jgi:hypothetical protein
MGRIEKSVRAIDQLELKPDKDQTFKYQTLASMMKVGVKPEAGE